jgi:hypothetical protein
VVAAIGLIAYRRRGSSRQWTWEFDLTDAGEAQCINVSGEPGGPPFLFDPNGLRGLVPICGGSTHSFSYRSSASDGTTWLRLAGTNYWVPESTLRPRAGSSAHGLPLVEGETARAKDLAAPRSARAITAPPERSVTRRSSPSQEPRSAARVAPRPRARYTRDRRQCGSVGVGDLRRRSWPFQSGVPTGMESCLCQVLFSGAVMGCVGAFERQRCRGGTVGARGPGVASPKSQLSGCEAGHAAFASSLVVLPAPSFASAVRRR